jgi:hypothetical protein
VYFGGERSGFVKVLVKAPIFVKAPFLVTYFLVCQCPPCLPPSQQAHPAARSATSLSPQSSGLSVGQDEPAAKE